jgi:hypothetical protein
MSVSISSLGNGTHKQLFTGLGTEAGVQSANKRVADRNILLTHDLAD